MNRRKILVLDDEPSLANGLRDKLNKEGFDADIARNGVDGLKMMEGKKYDMVLLDMVMPRMNGLAFLDAMKDPKPPVIGFSNNANGIMAEAMSKGVIRYFIKSDHSLREIMDYIKNYLDATPRV